MRSPWCRASRGRLTRRACVRLSSGREESNSHDPGSRPGGQPLTHTQMSLSFPHHGSNVNPRNQRPRCCRLHHAGVGWTTRLNSLGRRSPRLGSTLRRRPQFSEQGSNLCLRLQRPPSCQLDDPRASCCPPVENRTRISRLSCGRSAIELRAAAHSALCPVQELNLALRCFRPTLVTTRASGAKAGKVACFPAANIPLQFSESTSGATTLVGQRGFEPRSLG